MDYNEFNMVNSNNSGGGSSGSGCLSVIFTGAAIIGLSALIIYLIISFFT